MRGMWGGMARERAIGSQRIRAHVSGNHRPGGPRNKWLTSVTNVQRFQVHRMHDGGAHPTLTPPQNDAAVAEPKLIPL